MEQQILTSTVRIRLESWIVKPGDKGYEISEAIGHATVMDGRYLVTHNHFSFLLERTRAAGPDSYIVVYLYNSNGNMLYKGPLSEFELVREDEEILVIAHTDEGFFEKIGFTSANFQNWASLPVEAGMTVAQIDWNGERTRVDWATVEEVILEDGTPRLVIAGGTTAGASGGGIFWEGVHVANNWWVKERFDAAGDVVDAATTVALNSGGILNP